MKNRELGKVNDDILRVVCITVEEALDVLKLMKESRSIHPDLIGYVQGKCENLGNKLPES